MALKNNYSFSRLWEENYPAFLGFIFAILAYSFHFDIWLDFNTFLDSLLITSSIFVGFLGTSIGIIFAADSDRIKWLKHRKETWERAINFFKIAFSLNFLLCISSFILKSTNFSAFHDIKRLAFILTIFISVAAFLSFQRAIYLFFLMLMNSKH